MSWIPPERGSVKLNIDGLIVQGERGEAVAGICRESMGRIVGGFAERVVYCTWKMELIRGEENTNCGGNLI